MRTRPSMQKNCGRFRRQAMGTQTPKAAANTPSSFGTDHTFITQSTTMEVDSRDTSAPTWPACTEGPVMEDVRCTDSDTVSYTDEAALGSSCLPEELASLLRVMIREQDGDALSGEELAEEFLEASELPPVTKHSLSELDIQSIIINIKLRHDVNFDRDLSFRPNIDGIRGQEKDRVANKYWKALEAELELYDRLFQGTPPVSSTKLEELKHHAERRIPTLFRTVRDVLKSLVPDRDHSRVDEHLDVPMLMQAIERGVCDLVRLTEWIAQLLKEHCAPMRDGWVDEMVASMKEGVSTNSLHKIVEGLRGLFGILEAMKLDVANHQIRNLKTLLIEDTINFEKHYHLDRLVNGRTRVNISTAQSWFADAVHEFGPQCSPRPRPGPCFQLEVFTRAITAISFGRDGRGDFPETFSLDQDRLRVLKAEIDDLVMFEVCMEMFVALARQSGYEGPITLAIGQQLRIAICAIMADTAGHGPQQWVMSSEALSLEIMRQASRLVEQQSTHSFDRMAAANEHLRILFFRRSAYHAARLEASLLPQILASVDRHSTSSPMDLFNNLVPIAPNMPPLPSLARPSVSVSDTFAFAHLHPETAKLTDLANRITHIILLHWRVWAPIAYVQEDASRHSSPSAAALSSPASQTPSRQEDAPLPTNMRTGDASDLEQDSHVSQHPLPQ